jgi:hypothetical protein
MPAGTIARGSAPSGNSQQQQPAGNPFGQASWEYSEVMFTDTITPTASPQDIFHNITPGGFLRGVTFSVTGTGGALGAGVLAADFPWSFFNSLSIESVDGTHILYPMPGYSHYLISRFCRPQELDPAQDPGFVGTINFSFRLRLFCESLLTVGVVPNTDARAQYRLRWQAAPISGMFSTAPTTPPTVTVNQYFEAWAQPDRTDIFGRPNQQVPDGVALQRFASREIFSTSAGTQTFKSNRVGNFIRNNIAVVRNNAQARTDLTADPIRFRLDNTTLLTEFRDRRDYYMDTFYGSGGGSAGSFSVRPTGVYVWPRFRAPDRPVGQGWLPTAEATFLQWELNGLPASGTLEMITEDLAAVGPVAPYLVGT